MAGWTTHRPLEIDPVFEKDCPLVQGCEHKAQNEVGDFDQQATVGGVLVHEQFVQDEFGVEAFEAQGEEGYDCCGWEGGPRGGSVFYVRGEGGPC
jgi:hypothetical protein